MTDSTVAAAIVALQAKMQAVADANPALDPGVYLAEAVGGSVKNNWLTIGTQSTNGWSIFTNYASVYDDLEMASYEETYDLMFTIRALGGADDPAQRVVDGLTLYNGLVAQLAEDPHGGTALNGGHWSISQADNPLAGKIGSRGWGVILIGSVHVEDVYVNPL